MTNRQPRHLPLILLDSLSAALRGEDRLSESAMARHAELGARVREIARRSVGVGGIPRKGDWIKVSQGLTSHHGIYVSEKDVIHASKQHGVISTSFATFARGRQVMIVRRCDPGEEEDVVRRARATIGTPYSLFVANCEHLTSRVHEGQPSSAQMEMGTFLALLAGTAVLLTR